MNIFVLDVEPQQAAQWHMDVHVIKMILETAQLLCTAHHVTGGTAPYKATHVNHPCAVWARASRANYLWLVDLGMELSREYTARYGRTHATDTVLRYCAANVPDLADHERSPFAQAMPPSLTGPDPVAAYRRYYQTKTGGRMATWKKNRPDWWRPDFTVPASS